MTFLLKLAAIGLMGLAMQAAAASSEWAHPAADLAEQIAGVLGPGQARLVVRNLSSIPVADIPAIRKLIEQDLKTHGVLAAGAESANTIQVTLSENAQKRLWVAELVQGSEKRVTMVEFESPPRQIPVTQEQIQLRQEQYLGPFTLDSLPCFPDAKPPLLSVVESRHGLAVLKQGCLLALDRTPSGFPDGKGFYHLDSAQPPVRDPRGILGGTPDGEGFLAYFPGTSCTGSYTATQDTDRPPGEGWTLHCHPSDDPWPLLSADSPAGPIQFKAFYNAARNSFTGVVTPSVGVDLPPFYTLAVLERAGGPALLVGGIDGKVQLAENGTLKPVSGARDWGSDFAVLPAACGMGDLVIASASGEALSDSLRAYKLPGQEAIAASAPLAVEGTVTALSTAADKKSVLAIVRRADDQQEVVRVTAVCNE
jgi:hypothetical protein